MKNDVMTLKNKKTGKAERVFQENITEQNWGIEFFVESESDAYKAAYCYRNTPHGVRVDYAQGVNKWMVIVFNEFAAKCGMDGAK